jgi:hypothetical protein
MSYSFMTSALDGGEWSASCPGRALPPEKEPPVPIGHEAGRASEPVCTQRLEDNFVCFCRRSNTDRPVVQSVVRHYTDWATRLRDSFYAYLILADVSLTPLFSLCCLLMDSNKSTSTDTDLVKGRTVLMNFASGRGMCKTIIVRNTRCTYLNMWWRTQNVHNSFSNIFRVQGWGGVQKFFWCHVRPYQSRTEALNEHSLQEEAHAKNYYLYFPCVV